MKKKYIKFILLSFILIIIDQIVKYFMSNIEYINIINNFLKFDYIENDGAAFGILGGNTLVIILITLLVLVYLIIELIKNNSKLQIFSSLLIISGAIGNLIDRIYFKYVRDFISFRIFNKDMAIFNLADIYITLGVIIYIYIILRESSGKNERNNS